VIYGIGGMGKSTLAGQIANRISRVQSERVASVLSGELSAASVAAAETDFIICDNFDDNLSQESGQWIVRDPELAALLANWTGKLLITCRRPFTLADPSDAEAARRVPRPGVDRLAFRQLGPLTSSGAADLSAALPAIRLLTDAERDRIWRLTAGHPLAVEYLDALLARGEQFADVAGRIEAAIQARTGQPLPGTEPTELPAPASEAIACAASEQLFDDLFGRLSTGARALLVRASVCQVPVAAGAVAARPGQLAECEAAGLLVRGPGDELSVHRWTAELLQRRMTEANLPGQVTVPAASAGRRRVVRLGLAGAFAAMSVLLALEAAQAFSAPHLTASELAAPTVGQGAASQVVAVRDQAAAWVASQVSTGAILACDPAMCSALIQRGIPAANLLVLSPGAVDPLGSDVVLATAAVRGIFGNRLASVYAPDVLASFGTGPERIDIAVVAPDGTAAYRPALAADVRARQVAGDQLVGDLKIAMTAPARAQLTAGQVDARLLMTLATLAASEPLRIGAFTGNGPGASPGMPLRSVQLIASADGTRNMLAFFRAQRSPFLAARTSIAPDPSSRPGGQSVLTVEFAAPSPLGLLQGRS
jgi:hypothetical protein